MSSLRPASAANAPHAPFADLAQRGPNLPPIAPQAIRPAVDDAYDGEVRSPRRPAPHAPMLRACETLASTSADRGAVEAAARRGERHAVHYYLAHPQSYVRSLRFRDRCLEQARLHGLLMAHDANDKFPHSPARDYTWQAYARKPNDRVTTGADGKYVFVLSDDYAPAPCDQADFALERAEAFVYDLEPGVTVAHRPWHDCAWGTATPVLVLMALLQHGYAQQAQALLDAGCPLPTQVVEKWHVRATAPADGQSSWQHAWTVRQSPIGACLERAAAGVADTLRVVLAAGARPSTIERLRMLRWLPMG